MRGRTSGSFTRVTIALGLAASVLAACGSDDETTESTTAESAPEPAATDAPAESALPPADSALPPAGEGGELTIQDFTFSALTVAAGAEFSISNLDGFAHTVTSDTFDVQIDAGGTESLIIDDPGTYAIFCKIHPSMSGTIVVE